MPPLRGWPSTPQPLSPSLRHTLRALAPAHLPPFKGSMLRGAFGHALRR
ncbi:MAG TPA: hypothetical protein VFR03_20885 [Thermoanaerobaculia bacterium]|nr:hypothetical protein [Thermoanaerobaculia bacterium]